jgi:hypothetical protein
MNLVVGIAIHRDINLEQMKTNYPLRVDSCGESLPGPMKQSLRWAMLCGLLLAELCNADPLDTWISRNSGTNQTFSRIVCGNGRFVAIEGTMFVGFSTLTSQNGTNWIQGQQIPLPLVDDVAFGNNLFVAVGMSRTSSSGVAISPDGANWSIPPSVPGSTSGAFLEGVSYANGIFLAVGLKGTILTSLDGTNWVQRTSGSTDTLQKVAYGKGTYVAVGWLNGSVLTSTDGITWVSQLNIAEGLNDLTFDSGHFLAVGDFGLSYTSSDGTNWTGTYVSLGNLTSVSYGGGVFVAVADNGSIVSSLDGSNWTERSSGRSSPLRGVCFGHNSFVATGSNGSLLESQPLGFGAPKCGVGARLAFVCRSIANRGDRFGRADISHSSFNRFTELGVPDKCHAY